MRFGLDARAHRLLRRVPRTSVYSLLELTLLSLLAIQGARLVWAIVTPLGPLGDWRPAGAVPTATVSSAALTGFDPFFRLAGAAGPVAVTSLNLKLFGVREDRAAGHGSAFIGLPDGVQRSVQVGEEVVPGVTLAAVGFDSVTLNRGGASEQLFLDQSSPAPVATPPVQSGPPLFAPPAPPPPPPPVVQTAPPPPAVAAPGNSQ